MSKELQITDNTAMGIINEEQVAFLKSTKVIPNDAPTDQVAVFLYACREQGLSPFSKEIYLMGYGGKYTPVTGINGLRKIADRAGNFAGVDAPKYDLKNDGSFKTAAMFAKDEKPTTCTVIVYKVVGGIRCPFVAEVRFAEFYNSRNGKWNEMPFQMIAKVAEAHAIRKGWAISGVHVEEELDAIREQVTVENKLPAIPENMWDKAVERIKNGTATVEKLKEHYSLTKEQEKILYDLTPAANV